MKINVHCYPCLFKQALKLSVLAELNEEQTKEFIDETMKILLTASPECTAPHIATAMQKSMGRKYFPHEKFDPYSELKKMTNTKAMEYFEHLSRKTADSPDPLETAVKIAAAGNIIDFGADGVKNIDIDHEISKIDNIGFGIYDFTQLEEKLHSARSILYIGDNAGEIVFDKVLVNTLKSVNPEAEITFATREEPVINDITLDDAEFTGMTETAHVMSSGSIYPGTVLSEASEEFRNKFHTADLIISKGQGNFETLNDEDSCRLFFLMRVKCSPVSKYIGVDEGKLVLMQNKKQRNQ